jgi:micrococcal nuclease
MKLLVLLLTSLAWGQTIQGDLYGPYTFSVVDADTLDLNGTALRLIGVDTPETRYNEKLYRQASVQGLPEETLLALGYAAKNYVSTYGQGIFLERDISETDKYGRLLGYVYIKDPEGGWIKNGIAYRQLNADLLRYGYAYQLTLPPDVRYADVFTSLTQQAVQARLGIWNVPAPLNSDVRIVCVNANPPGQDAGNESVLLSLEASKDLTGYVIRDASGHTLTLQGVFPAGQTTITFPGEAVWNNDGDTARLFRPDKTVISEYRYQIEESCP